MLYYPPMLDVVKRACDVVGGIDALADKLGCTRQAVYQWDAVPRGRVLEIEEATGRQVTRTELRPDIYPQDPDAASAPRSAASSAASHQP